MNPKTRAPVRPGEVLLDEFLEPMDVSQYRLAKDISVPPRCINEIVHGKRSVTVDAALRLARYFGTSERVERDKLGDRLEQEVVRRVV